MYKVIKNSLSIFCMSKKMKDIGAALEDTTRPLIKHLIKLYLYPNSQYVKHWRQEVYDFLNSIPMIKGKNKLPTKKFILQNTLDINKSLISAWIRQIKEDYSIDNEELNYDNQVIIDSICNYYDWLADSLSKEGSISRFSAYKTMKSLGFGN